MIPLDRSSSITASAHWSIGLIGCVEDQIGIGRLFVLGGDAREIPQFARIGLGVLALGVALATNFDRCRYMDDQEPFVADQLANFLRTSSDGATKEAMQINPASLRVCAR